MEVIFLSQPLIISLAIPADLPALRQLFFTTRQSHFPWLDAQTLTLTDFDVETVDEVIFVAKRGPQVLGFLAFYEPDAFIHHLFVAPEFQGGGVGRALIQQLQASTRRPLTLKCAQANTPALQFYARLGFVETATVAANPPYVVLTLQPNA